MQAYIIPEITKASENYSLGLIATNEDNGDLLYAVDGVISVFEEDYPLARRYYDGNWFQNVYPNSPGETPLEKYLNGLANMSQPNPPNWSNILPAISSNAPILLKLLTTQNPNAFSSLQTTVSFRNMDLFKFLAAQTIMGIPDGLTQTESEELKAILVANNFPSLSELM
jgi:hypothetical protein